MNRLTLMQTQSQVPIRHFNSSSCVASANSPLHATRNPLVAISTNASSLSDADPTSLKSSQQYMHCDQITHEASVEPSSASTVSSIAPAKDHECLMLVTIKSDSVADLRHLVMRTCGGLIVFIKTQPIAHATKMKVWLCLNGSAADLVMDAVMRSLPSAEFGRITHG